MLIMYMYAFPNIPNPLVFPPPSDRYYVDMREDDFVSMTCRNITYKKRKEGHKIPKVGLIEQVFVTR